MALMETDELAQALRGAGHRMTKPRRAVWLALRQAPGHLTVEELAAEVQRHEPGVNLASVYRSLTVFQDLDLVRESRLGSEDAGRWELAHPDEHFHLVCEVCGAIDHHVGTLVDEIRSHLSEGHGFEPREIELIVTGRCHDCAGH